MRDHSISLDQAIYDNSIGAKYLDTATVKSSKKFYNTTLPSDMIFTKANASTSNYQVEKLTREFNIHYRDLFWKLIYLLSTRVYLSFIVHKLAKFSLNPDKVNLEGLVNLLIYIRENNTLGLKYYTDMKDALLLDILRQANIKTDKQLRAFYDSSWKYCTETGISTGSYIIFYQGGPIDHVTHVPGTVVK